MKTFTPPAGFKNKQYKVFHTNTDFTEKDYEAVMASKAELRMWSDSEWPADTFSIEENRTDLSYHVADNNDHSAYG